MNPCFDEKILKLERDKKYQEAISLTRLLLRETKDRKIKTQLNIRLGWLHDQFALQKEDKKEAFELQKKALYYFKKSKSTNRKVLAESYRGIATVYHHRRNFQKAIQYYRMAHKVHPNSKLLYNSLGNIYQKMGIQEDNEKHLDTALNYYKKSLSLSKNDDEKLVPLANLAILSKRLKKRKESVIYAKKALSIAKKNLSINDLIREMEKISKD